MAIVGQQLDIIEERTRNRPTVEQMIRAVAQVEDKSDGFTRFAIAARPGSSSRKRLLNPARDVFLLRNLEELRPLYPKLYDSSRMRQAIARLAGVPDPAPAGGGVRIR